VCVSICICHGTRKETYVSTHANTCALPYVYVHVVKAASISCVSAYLCVRNVYVCACNVCVRVHVCAHVHAGTHVYEHACAREYVHVHKSPRPIPACSDGAVDLSLREECLLKTDSGYPKDAGIPEYTMATPGNLLRYNTPRLDLPVSALAHSRGPGAQQAEGL